MQRELGSLRQPSTIGSVLDIDQALALPEAEVNGRQVRARNREDVLKASTDVAGFGEQKGTNPSPGCDRLHVAKR